MSGFSKALLLLLFLLAPAFSSQFSPGDLNASHAHLEGLGNCLKCHEAAKKVSHQKCLNCHSAVAKNKGLHSRADYQNCLTCHKDHLGKESSLIRWSGGKPDSFNHNITGFRLEGKHRQLACDKCHTAKQIANQKTSYLGLSKDCFACHKDPHQNQLSSTCTNCHNQDSWKPSPHFNHNKTRYKLTGRHASLKCAQCHKRSTSNGSMLFNISNYSTCSACHEDKHKGLLGTTCEKCHSTESWKTLAKGVPFNHDLTRYPLKGKHTSVKCQQCHPKDKKNDRPLVYNKCEGCHKNTHVNEVTQSPCESCHTVAQFSPATYSMARHNAQTHFKISGAHLAVSCKACHVRPLSKQWDFRSHETGCANCHPNKHKGAFRAINEAKACDACHDDRNWVASKFNHNQDSRYILDGAHRKLACRVCHQGGIYQPLPLTCQGCHINGK